LASPNATYAAPPQTAYQVHDGIGAPGCCFAQISAKHNVSPRSVVEILLQGLH